MPEEIDQLQSLIESLTSKLISYTPQIIGASVILIIGLLVGSSISKLILGICTKKEIDVTLSRFFSNSIKAIIILLFVFIAVRKLDVDVTPFIALLGAGALGLSLAVQGPVSNYGSGIAIILTRPFKVHDTLTIHGLTGIVSLISLRYTLLETEDGQEVTIPNKKILGEILVNSFTNLVVEGSVGIVSSPNAG
jgi:small conductance mechanosensitive channel